MSTLLIIAGILIGLFILFVALITCVFIGYRQAEKDHVIIISKWGIKR